MWKRWICGGLLWGSASAFAVSRVGGGVLTNDEMAFHAPIPVEFLVAAMTADGDLRLQSPRLFLSFAGGLPQAEWIEIFMLPNARPDLVSVVDRMQMQMRFEQEGWKQHPSATDCVDWYEKDNAQTHTITLVWGSGQGVVLTALHVGTSLAALEQFAEGLQNRSCGWK